MIYLAISPPNCSLKPSSKSFVAREGTALPDFCFDQLRGMHTICFVLKGLLTNSCLAKAYGLLMNSLVILNHLRAIRLNPAPGNQAGTYFTTTPPPHASGTQTYKIADKIRTGRHCIDDPFASLDCFGEESTHHMVCELDKRVMTIMVD